MAVDVATRRPRSSAASSRAASATAAGCWRSGRAWRCSTCSSRSSSSSCSRSTTTRAASTSPGRASRSTTGRTRSPTRTSRTALKNSLVIALISTLIAAALGTFMALALVRYGFRGARRVDLFVFLPLATPEVVLGAALLALFLTIDVNTGFVTIVIAHVMFTVSYVVVTVKARLEGMDRHIEEAAMDLGATEWTTFRKVTLPMIAPGVAAAALLAAAISIDDYVITSFNAGQTQTFPLFIFGATRQGVPPEVNVLATVLLIVVLVLMGLNVLVQRGWPSATRRAPRNRCPRLHRHDPPSGHERRRAPHRRYA